MAAIGEDESEAEHPKEQMGKTLLLVTMTQGLQVTNMKIIPPPEHIQHQKI
jgi:hypothetical protein